MCTSPNRRRDVANKLLVFSSFETGEVRTPLPAGVRKETVLRKLHDMPFMVSCSPVSDLKGHAEHPSAWIISEAEKVHAETPNATGPVSYWTMREHSLLGEWVPLPSHTIASIYHTDGYKSVVDAIMGTHLSMETRIVETEGVGLELVETMRGEAFMPMSDFVKKSFLDAHVVMTRNLIDHVVIES